MEVNDQRDVAGKDVEDMTLEQLSEVRNESYSAKKVSQFEPSNFLTKL